MPIERRSARVQTTTIVISVVALAAALLLAVLVFRAATGGDDVAIRLGDDVFAAGAADERAEAIAGDGPLLFSDVSGRGQRRPIYLQHLGDDPETGWYAFDARPPAAAEGCFLEWDAAARRFVGVDGCTAATYPADGEGLDRYPVVVSRDGDLSIDLREELDPAGGG